MAGSMARLIMKDAAYECAEGNGQDLSGNAESWRQMAGGKGRGDAHKGHGLTRQGHNHSMPPKLANSWMNLPGSAARWRCRFHHACIELCSLSYVRVHDNPTTPPPLNHTSLNHCDLQYSMPGNHTSIDGEDQSDDPLEGLCLVL